MAIYEKNLKSLDKNIMMYALDASSDGVLICDENANIIYINNAYEETTGLKKNEMIGFNLNELLEKKVFNTSVSLKVLETKMEQSAIHKYKTGKSALTTARPIYLDDEIVGVFCNTRNITDLISLRKELESAKELSFKYKEELKQYRKEQLEIDGLIYKSKIMEETLDFALKVAPFDTTVLITGESGTGKEVIAKYIHQHSERSNGPFIKVNCSAIPGELFESELFGYVAGAFTGANNKGKTGLFELADGGTILLDELGELDITVQPKLLRVIQEMEVLPVGSEETRKIDVRVLAATNLDLKEEVKEGRFREDLYFRLNVVPIHMPPLRNRKDDINEIAMYFMDRLNHKYKKNIIMTEEVKIILNNYSWPGNVRELENLVEYLFIVNPRDEITVEQLPSWIVTEHLMEETEFNEKSKMSRLNYMLDMYEKNIITIALRKHNSVRETAKTLDVHPSTLFRKINKHNIDIGFFKDI